MDPQLFITATFVGLVIVLAIIVAVITRRLSGDRRGATDRRPGR
jgi:hypothetical protein